MSVALEDEALNNDQGKDDNTESGLLMMAGEKNTCPYRRLLLGWAAISIFFVLFMDVK
jgi:hypothetical protein